MVSAILVARYYQSPLQEGAYWQIVLDGRQFDRHAQKLENNFFCKERGLSRTPLKLVKNGATAP